MANKNEASQNKTHQKNPEAPQDDPYEGIDEDSVDALFPDSPRETWLDTFDEEVNSQDTGNPFANTEDDETAALLNPFNQSVLEEAKKQHAIAESKIYNASEEELSNTLQKIQDELTSYLTHLESELKKHNKKTGMTSTKDFTEHEAQQNTKKRKSLNEKIKIIKDISRLALEEKDESCEIKLSKIEASLNTSANLKVLNPSFDNKAKAFLQKVRGWLHGMKNIHSKEQLIQRKVAKQVRKVGGNTQLGWDPTKKRRKM